MASMKNDQGISWRELRALVATALTAQPLAAQVDKSTLGSVGLVAPLETGGRGLERAA